jgi:predicted transcriptional regulator of viral defense system
MGFSTTQSSAEAWALAEEQEGVISHRQLRALGFSARAIRHRVAKGRLHRRYRGVYVVGRPELSRAGEMMAAVLRCGEGAVLSHESAAELWGIRRRRRGPIEVSVPIPRDPRARGIRVHRRLALAAAEIDKHGAIPLTNPNRTLVDLAVRLPRDQLEAAVNEAAISDHVEPEALRASLETRRGQPGVRVLRTSSTGTPSGSRTPSSSGGSCGSSARRDFPYPRRRRE